MKSKPKASLSLSLSLSLKIKVVLTNFEVCRIFSSTHDSYQIPSFSSRFTQLLPTQTLPLSSSTLLPCPEHSNPLPSYLLPFRMLPQLTNHAQTCSQRHSLLPDSSTAGGGGWEICCWQRPNRRKILTQENREKGAEFSSGPCLFFFP